MYLCSFFCVDAGEVFPRYSTRCHCAHQIQYLFWKVQQSSLKMSYLVMKAFNFPVASIFHETMFRKFRKRFTETSEMYKTAE